MLFNGLDTFGYHLHPELVAHRHHVGNDAPCGSFVAGRHVLTQCKFGLRPYYSERDADTCKRRKHVREAAEEKRE